MHLLLPCVVQKLIGILLRAIWGGREKKLDLVAMVIRPCSYCSRFVYRQIVTNEEYLSRRIADESFEKDNEQVCVESTMIEHEAEIAPIGGRRNHGERCVPGGKSYGWGLSFENEDSHD